MLGKQARRLMLTPALFAALALSLPAFEPEPGSLDDAREGARDDLLELMHKISEDLWAAGWREELELDLWSAQAADGLRPRAADVGPNWCDELARLAEAAGGWWVHCSTVGEEWQPTPGGRAGCPGRRFLPTAEWLRLYADATAEARGRAERRFERRDRYFGHGSPPQAGPLPPGAVVGPPATMHASTAAYLDSPERAARLALGGPSEGDPLEAGGVAAVPAEAALVDTLRLRGQHGGAAIVGVDPVDPPRAAFVRFGPHLDRCPRIVDGACGCGA